MISTVKLHGEAVEEIVPYIDRLDEFCDFFGVEIDDEDVQTIGGYVVKNLGRIADEKDEVQDKYFKYCVTKVDSTRIDKLCVEKNEIENEQVDE